MRDPFSISTADEMPVLERDYPSLRYYFRPGNTIILDVVRGPGRQEFRDIHSRLQSIAYNVDRLYGSE